MKNVLHRIKASVLYFIFAFLIFLFVSAVTHPDRLRFRNGETPTDGQRDIAVFVLFLMVVIAGYGAFKSAQRDLRLWRKTHKKSDDDHVA
jgi:membrane protease YdiL (CAAX protease family)